MNAEHDKTGLRKIEVFRFWLFVGIFFATLLFMLVLSSKFNLSFPMIEKPIILFTMCMLVAGLVFWRLLKIIPRLFTDRRFLLMMIVVGVVFRIPFFFSTPILEDDFYRYLWDGAVVAQGLNPYTYVPKEAFATPMLAKLAKQSGDVHARINHPTIRTIYPPVAQTVFAISYWLKPWHLGTWRFLLFLFDLLTLGLLLQLLRKTGMPWYHSLIYWWNPLLIKEIYNSAHMDILLLPFVLGALLLTLYHRTIAAMVLLGLSIGVKVWPIVLLPVIIRPVLFQWRKWVPGVGLLGIMLICMAWPIWNAGLDQSSGFTAYSQRWEMNDAIFMVILWIAKWVQNHLWDATGNGFLLARVISMACLAGVVLHQVWNHAKDAKQLLRQAMVITAVLFLLSPTQFPWYYVWVLPFLVFIPKPSLIWLSLLLPIYYLRFYFRAHDTVAVFDHGIVWLEYAPVFVLLGWEWCKNVSRTKR